MLASSSEKKHRSIQIAAIIIFIYKVASNRFQSPSKASLAFSKNFSNPSNLTSELPIKTGPLTFSTN